MIGIETIERGGGAPTILFMHGLGGDAASFADQVDVFSDRHRCISWTMPGYGESDPVEVLSFQALARASANLIEGEGPVVVVGQSMGAMVAMELAMSRPDLVAGLVLTATTAVFGKPGSAFNEEFLAARLAPLEAGRTPADLAPSVVDGLLGPAPASGARSSAITSMSRITPEAYRGALGCLVTWDARDELPGMSIDVLCIAGADDMTAPVSAMQRLTDLIPNATLEVLADCGHLTNLERPVEFNEMLLGFLERLDRVQER